MILRRDIFGAQYIWRIEGLGDKGRLVIAFIPCGELESVAGHRFSVRSVGAEELSG